MTKEMWLNLPVKDIKKARAFYSHLGFAFNSERDTEHTACMLVGDQDTGKETIVMLFSEHVFQSFTHHPIADTRHGSQVLFSIDAESREEVNHLAARAEAAGGKVFAKPAENTSWMYGCGFCDPDGHRWNVLFMDMDKMGKF